MDSEQQILPVVALDSKKVQEIQASIPRLVAQAQDLEIVDNDDYLTSGTLLDLVLDRQKKITDFFEEPAKQANNVHKFITSLRATLLTPLQQVEELMKGRRRDFRTKQERKRRLKEEEERKLAKEQAEQEAIREAAQLEEIGETEAANTIIERAASAPPPPVVVPSTIPKEQGKSVRKVYKFRITNAKLIKREFLMPDESNIGSIVSRLGPDAASIVGGIEVYPDEIETIRRKK
jgi:hypothetical protein